MEPDFEDSGRLSQLIQMTASDLSYGLVENAVSNAMHSSTIGFDYLGTRSNPYSDTMQFLNIAKNCVKSNQVKVVLEDLAFHLDFLMKKLFQKGNLKVMVHSDNPNKKMVGREVKKMLSSLEQKYPLMKNELKTRASKSKTKYPSNYQNRLS
jgi:Zn-dependent M16 (insulinase) family peptidase